jgi:excisionase family DNA binding protein
MDYLTILEVSKILKVHTNTAYKMCRQGLLPAVKIGKEWRVDHQELTAFMQTGITPSPKRTGERPPRPILQTGHTLGIFSETEAFLDFERRFFLSAPRKHYRFLKACWWQDPNTIRSELAQAGLPLEEMEAGGDLIVLNLSDIFERFGPVGAAGAWFKEVTSALEHGYKGVYGSGSPTFTCCGTHAGLLEFESALHQMLKGLPVTAVCSYILSQTSSESLAELVGLIERHDQFFIQTQHKQLMAKVIN